MVFSQQLDMSSNFEKYPELFNTINSKSSRQNTNRGILIKIILKIPLFPKSTLNSTQLRCIILPYSLIFSIIRE